MCTEEWKIERAFEANNGGRELSHCLYHFMRNDSCIMSHCWNFFSRFASFCMLANKKMKVASCGCELKFHYCAWEEKFYLWFPLMLETEIIHPTLPRHPHSQWALNVGKCLYRSNFAIFFEHSILKIDKWYHIIVLCINQKITDRKQKMKFENKTRSINRMVTTLKLSINTESPFNNDV